MAESSDRRKSAMISSLTVPSLPHGTISPLSNRLSLPDDVMSGPLSAKGGSLRTLSVYNNAAHGTDSDSSINEASLHRSVHRLPPLLTTPLPHPTPKGFPVSATSSSALFHAAATAAAMAAVATAAQVTRSKSRPLSYTAPVAAQPRTQGRPLSACQSNESSQSGYFSLEDRVEAVQRQIEYYFSDENLSKDVYLLSQMDKDGFVPLSLIASFKRVRLLTDDMGILQAAISRSSLLTMDISQMFIRSLSSVIRTRIILHDLPLGLPQEHVLVMLSQHGCLAPQHISSDGPLWQIEYSSPEDALSTLGILRTAEAKGVPLRARVDCKSTQGCDTGRHTPLSMSFSSSPSRSQSSLNSMPSSAMISSPSEGSSSASSSSSRDFPTKTNSPWFNATVAQVAAAAAFYNHITVAASYHSVLPNTKRKSRGVRKQSQQQQQQQQQQEITESDAGVKKLSVNDQPSLDENDDFHGNNEQPTMDNQPVEREENEKQEKAEVYEEEKRETPEHSIAHSPSKGQSTTSMVSLLGTSAAVPSSHTHMTITEKSPGVSERTDTANENVAATWTRIVSEKASIAPITASRARTETIRIANQGQHRRRPEEGTTATASLSMLASLDHFPVLGSGAGKRSTGFTARPTTTPLSSTTVTTPSPTLSETTSLSSSRTVSEGDLTSDPLPDASAPSTADFGQLCKNTSLMAL